MYLDFSCHDKLYKHWQSTSNIKIHKHNTEQVRLHVVLHFEFQVNMLLISFNDEAAVSHMPHIYHNGPKDSDTFFLIL